MQEIEIHKFGGTSVATAERIKHVVSLVINPPSHRQKIVVVSALGGVTDSLIDAIEKAQNRNVGYHQTIEQLIQRHEIALRELVSVAYQASIRSKLDTLWHLLSELLDGVYLLRECTPRTRDTIISLGERASVQLVAGAFKTANNKADSFEATAFIRTDDTFGNANVDFPTTQTLVLDSFRTIPKEQITVVTGFIGCTEDGVLTTLGRSGSDYTATILAWALDAKEVIIWTDVDGVLTADPRMVSDAFTLPLLTYQEASELAYFGAKVLHPKTMRPLQEKNIPLITKNTLNPTSSGTIISNETSMLEGRVKGVTSIRKMALLNLEGGGMLGIPGVTARACTSLAHQDINILMVTQASSEQSLSFVIQEADIPLAIDALKNTFEREIKRGDIASITSQRNVSVVAVVGDHMRHTPGIAGRMMQTLGNSNINIFAIAQGSSERNISVVVDESQVEAAVNVLHETFAMNRKRIHLIMIGTGGVAKSLLEIVQQKVNSLREEEHLNLKLIALANSKRMILSTIGLPFELNQVNFETGETKDLETLVQSIKEYHLENVVVIDNTASEEVAKCYPLFVNAGFHIVTPNKIANTLDLTFYSSLKDSIQQQKREYHYEGTVGAALPLISTLQNLKKSGDEVLKIEGVLSGTLAYVFNGMMEGNSFSEMVLKAKQKGYTEPDPREDFSGHDIARKMLILARELSLPLSFEDIQIENLLPRTAFEGNTKDFLNSLVAYDDTWHQNVQFCLENKRRLQYVGILENNKIQIRLEKVAPENPLFGLRGTDNLVSFYTKRYRSPLVIRGAGAGTELTASTVFTDLLQVADKLG